MDSSNAYRVGFSTVDITPPLSLKVRLGGYLRIHNFSRKVLDPLYARAICFRHATDQQKSLLLMSCDVVGFQYRLIKIVRNQLFRITGIPQSNIMLHLTHSHTSPDAIGIFPNHLTQFLNTDVQYPVVKYMMKQMIFAGKNAFRDAKLVCKIGFGFSAALDESLAVQRRPPYQHFHDPLRIIKITEETGNIIAVLVNYQGHPTQLPQVNSDMSAEYPGAVAKALYQSIPTLQFAAYFNGFIGDVSIHGYKGYYRSKHHGHASHEEAMQVALNSVQALGQKMVKYVLDVIDSIPTEPIQIIEMHRRFLFPIPFRIKPIKDRWNLYHGVKAKFFMLNREFLNTLRICGLLFIYRIINGRHLAMLNIHKNGHYFYHQTECYLFRINDIYWFASPGEPFNVYQKKLFAQVPQRKAFCNCMANDTCGYIFPWSFHIRGGYENTFSFDMLFGEYLYRTFTDILNKI